MDEQAYNPPEQSANITPKEVAEQSPKASSPVNKVVESSPAEPSERSFRKRSGSSTAYESSRQSHDSNKASEHSTAPEDRDESMNESKDSGSHNTSGESEDGNGDKKIRRSTRDIKRPKFDDELVESGISFLTQTQKKRQSSERAQSIVSELATSAHHVPATVNSSNTTEMSASSSSNLVPASVSSNLPSTSKNSAEEPMDVSEVTTIGKGSLTTPVTQPTTVSVTNSTKTDASKAEQPSPTTKMGVGLRKRNVISIEDRQAMEDALMEEEAARLEKKRREARIASKDIRAKELAAAHEAAEALCVEDLRAWTAADDVALVTAVSHVCDLMAVHSNIVFSKEYSLAEIEERWYQLMYDDTLSRQAKKRMNELPVNDILRIQSCTVFSQREEELVLSVPSHPVPDLRVMDVLLRSYPEDFHSARTPQVLLDHWHLLKMSGLMRSSVCTTSLPSTDWDRIERNTVISGDNLALLDEGRYLRAANACETAQRQWAKVSVEPVTGIVNDVEMGEDVVATIRGRVVLYWVRTDRVILGRSTYKSKVDVNLALEGPALKISRRQAMLERSAVDGSFTLQNLGRRPIQVDGKTLLQQQKTELRDGSVIEISLLRLVLKLAPARYR